MAAIRASQEGAPFRTAALYPFILLRPPDCGKLAVIPDFGDCAAPSVLLKLSHAHLLLARKHWPSASSDRDEK
jgi:hypothetical protein